MTIYKLKDPNANYFKEDLMTILGRNRGIKDISLLKNPSSESVIPYENLLKIDKIVNALMHFKTQGITKVGLVVDSDTDGYTSSAILYHYLNRNFPDFDIIYYIHPGKEHGITSDVTEWSISNKISILLVPDAGSGDFANQEILYNQGILVCVIDHHEADSDSEYALVVNSQLSPDYYNKQLSGVGMVYRLLEALDDALGICEADYYLDLTSLGNVADSMDITEPETRYFVYEGIKNIKNPFYKELIFQFVGKWANLNPTSMAWDIAPKLNGCIRFGSMEEKEDMFKAMAGIYDPDAEYENTKARTEKNRFESFLQRATRQCKNAHGRQNNAKKKWMKTISERIEEQGLQNNVVIPIIIGKKEKFDSNLSGLIAGSLTSKYSRPILILREKDGNLMGSMRGYDPFSLDTKSLLLDTRMFNWIQGHPNAAGVSISSDNLPLLEEELLKRVTVKESEKKITEVDFVFEQNQIGRFVVDNIEDHKKYWSKGFDSPIIAVKDLQASFRDVTISSGGMIKWSVNGIDFTQFVADVEFEKYVETNQTLLMDVVGSVGINEYMGKVNYQFVVSDFEIKKVEEVKNKGFGFLF